jgi:hypothetical protein
VGEEPHAQAGIGCYECHQTDKQRSDGFEHFGQRISVIVTPKSCGTCHAQEAQELQASHHAQAGQILGSLDNVLGEDEEGPAAAAMGCAKCHGSVVKVVGNGKLDPATWPNGHRPGESRRLQGLLLRLPQPPHLLAGRRSPAGELRLLSSGA